MKPHFPHLLTDIDLENVNEINAARFHTWFENRTAHDPDLLALYSGEQRRSVTYQNLNEQANKKAHCQYTTCFLLSPSLMSLL